MSSCSEAGTPIQTDSRCRRFSTDSHPKSGQESTSESTSESTQNRLESGGLLGRLPRAHRRLCRHLRLLQRCYPGPEDDRGLRSLLPLRRGARLSLIFAASGKESLQLELGATSGRARSGPGIGMAGVWRRRCVRGQADMGRGYELRASGVRELGESGISTAEERAEALRNDARPTSEAPWSSTPRVLRHAPGALDRLPPPPQEPALHHPLVMRELSFENPRLFLFGGECGDEDLEGEGCGGETAMAGWRGAADCLGFAAIPTRRCGVSRSHCVAGSSSYAAAVEASRRRRAGCCAARLGVAA
ncbi:hypothetical protein DFH09DRAFT_1293072 [Mycena vulgaris]|nr:hypothetical protein DFH09DRAFT_1293072 [Mycena vulgaris]